MQFWIRYNYLTPKTLSGEPQNTYDLIGPFASRHEIGQHTLEYGPIGEQVDIVCEPDEEEQTNANMVWSLQEHITYMTQRI